jgi:hypothetical protein
MWEICRRLARLRKTACMRLIHKRIVSIVDCTDNCLYAQFDVFVFESTVAMHLYESDFAFAICAKDI